MTQYYSSIHPWLRKGAKIFPPEIPWKYTNEARMAAIEAAQRTPWTYDTCLQRLLSLKSEVERTGDVDKVRLFFAGMADYFQKRYSVGEEALREENFRRMHEMWFKHLDDWYTELMERPF